VVCMYMVCSMYSTYHVHTYHMVHGTWYMAHGTWHMVHGTWYMVCTGTLYVHYMVCTPHGMYTVHGSRGSSDRVAWIGGSRGSDTGWMEHGHSKCLFMGIGRSRGDAWHTGILTYHVGR